METKALKKQLGAAIAMVVVAAIALGSATYAWFVSNNSVTANTSTVSAKSNSAYLVIANAAAKTGDDSTKVTTTSSTTSADASETNANVSLYPATWDNTFTSEKGSTKADSTTNGVYQFESAYASSKDSANEAGLDSATGVNAKTTRFAVGSPSDAANGQNPYALLNTFYVGTGTYDGIFTNLKVTGFAVSNTSGDSASDLPSAMRALVKCGNNWVVVKMGANNTAEVVSQKDKTGSTDSPFDGIIRSAEFGQLTAGQTDAQVDVYLYYEGSDSRVYTENLSKLSGCHVTLTFEATPTEYGKNSTGA